MRLLVISHTPHHRGDDGRIAGWGATVRELDAIAGTVDQLVHLAPLHPGAPSAAMRPYSSENVRFVAVAPAGGESMRAKLGIITALPQWVRAMRREMASADAVHVRLPANISFIAVLLLVARRRPARRWFKYAGTWDARRGVGWSYRMQRWGLRRLRPMHRGVVTIAGSALNQPRHVVALLNPALSDAELGEGRASHDRVTDGSVRIVFAGRLEHAKGALVAVATARRLAEWGHSVHLDLAGDGPLRGEIERDSAVADGLVTVHGWLDRHRLNALYADAHVVLLPSMTEGFPKVLAEGMAFGAVPVASDVGSIRAVFAEVGAGIVTDAADDHAFAQAIGDLMATPERWQDESARARRAASAFTYDRYVRAVSQLLERAPP